jgi:hypothetical protein
MCTEWRKTLSFTRRLSFPMENNKTKIRRVDRPQNIYGYFGEEKYLLSLLEMETLFLVRLAHSPVTLAIKQ